MTASPEFSPGGAPPGRALRFAGYEHQFVMTEGGHSGTFGGERLPSALRWLWSDQVQ